MSLPSSSFKHTIIKTLLSIFLFLIILVLFKTGLLKNYIVGGPSENYFIDLELYIRWWECDKIENFDETCKNFVVDYGKLFLLIPFSQSLKFFYINYLPYIIILLFVFAVTFLLNPKKKLDYFIVVLAILNSTSLVLIERLNFDIIIFLALIIIALNRIYILNWILFFYCFLIKLFPIVSGIFLFLENKKRSTKFLLLLIIFFGIIASYFLYIGYFPISDLQGSGAKAGYWHLFSLNTIPKIFKYFGANYIFSLVLIYSLFLYLVYKLFRSDKINEILENQDFFANNWKLFLVGGNILLVCFIFYSNPSHREVYLILLIPQLLYFKSQGNKIANFIFYLLIFRYLFLFIYGPANVPIESTYYLIDGKRVFSSIFLLATFIKGVFDFIFFALIGTIVFKTNFLILKKFFYNLKLLKTN